MADTLAISCPECDKLVKVPADLEGKKIKCKGCNHVFVVRAKGGGKAAAPKGKAADAAGIKKTPDVKAKAKAPDPKAKQPAPSSADEDEDDNVKYGLRYEDLSPRCPACAAKLESPDSRVCIECGYNLVTRVAHKTVSTIGHTTGDIILWLLPGILAILSAILLLSGFVFYHYFLPAIMYENWDQVYEDQEGSRRKTVDKLEGILPYMFHPGIEIPMLVFILFIVWYCCKFGFIRLVIKNTPPEKIKN